MSCNSIANLGQVVLMNRHSFRAAKEAEQQIELAKKKGEKLPETDRFDSNCITPGTAFMVRLQDALKNFVQEKISTNPLWRKCKIILSGHEVRVTGRLTGKLKETNLIFISRLPVKVNIRLWSTFAS